MADLLVLTSLDQLLLIMKILFMCLTKQGILMRRSTVLSLPFQFVFPGRTHKLYLHWRRLRDNAVVVACDSDIKQYLPWPPWVTRHR
jgi:hypothetical protein